MEESSQWSPVFFYGEHSRKTEIKLIPEKLNLDIQKYLGTTYTCHIEGTQENKCSLTYIDMNQAEAKINSKTFSKNHFVLLQNYLESLKKLEEGERISVENSINLENICFTSKIVRESKKLNSSNKKSTEVSTNSNSEFFVHKSATKFEIEKKQRKYLCLPLDYEIDIEKKNIKIIYNEIKPVNLHSKISKLEIRERLKIFRKILLGYGKLWDLNMMHYRINSRFIYMMNEKSFALAEIINEGHLGNINFSNIDQTNFHRFINVPPEDDLQHPKPSSERFQGINGEKYDIWSLGCLLFELLFKKPFFEEKSLNEFRKKRNQQTNITIVSKIDKEFNRLDHKEKICIPPFYLEMLKNMIKINAMDRLSYKQAYYLVAKRKKVALFNYSVLNHTNEPEKHDKQGKNKTNRYIYCDHDDITNENPHILSEFGCFEEVQKYPIRYSTSNFKLIYDHTLLIIDFSEGKCEFFKDKISKNIKIELINVLWPLKYKRNDFKLEFIFPFWPKDTLYDLIYQPLSLKVSLSSLLSNEKILIYLKQVYEGLKQLKKVQYRCYLVNTEWIYVDPDKVSLGGILNQTLFDFWYNENRIENGEGGQVTRELYSVPPELIPLVQRKKDFSFESGSMIVWNLGCLLFEMLFKKNLIETFNNDAPVIKLDNLIKILRSLTDKRIEDEVNAQIDDINQSGIDENKYISSEYKELILGMLKVNKDARIKEKDIPAKINDLIEKKPQIEKKEKKENIKESVKKITPRFKEYIILLTENHINRIEFLVDLMICLKTHPNITEMKIDQTKLNRFYDKFALYSLNKISLLQRWLLENGTCELPEISGYIGEQVELEEFYMKTIRESQKGIKFTRDLEHLQKTAETLLTTPKASIRVPIKLKKELDDLKPQEFATLYAVYFVDELKSVGKDLNTCLYQKYQEMKETFSKKEREFILKTIIKVGKAINVGKMEFTEDQNCIAYFESSLFKKNLSELEVKSKESI